MKKNSKRAQALRDAAKDMPPLRHSFDGEKFDIDESEVVDWLVENPVVRQTIFDTARNVGAIIYDPEDGTWCGCDYDDR